MARPDRRRPDQLRPIHLTRSAMKFVDHQRLLDLAYQEDSRADVDMNVVMTGRGEFVELQGTAERRPFGTRDLQQMLRLATRAIRQLITHQRRVLGARSVRGLS